MSLYDVTAGAPIVPGDLNQIVDLINGLPSTLTQTTTSVNSLLSGLVGGVIAYAGAAAPTGWLLCDGSLISRTTYAPLFTVIGTAYGAGDGSTTFALPDLRGRVPIGAGTGPTLTTRSRGDVIGEENHTLSGNELTSHTHGVNDPGHTHQEQQHTSDFEAANYGLSITLNYRNRVLISGFAGGDDIESAGKATSISLGTAGASWGHNTIQPSLGLNMIIKT